MTVQVVDWDALSIAARQAAASAYCPYSRFPVGAAVLSDDGAIFTGCNVENASYGLTICAERNALFQMVAATRRVAVAICIYTTTDDPSPPCGACRQVLREFQQGQLAILCVCNHSNQLQTSLDALLPNSFGPANLGPTDP